MLRGCWECWGVDGRMGAEMLDARMLFFACDAKTYVRAKRKSFITLHAGKYENTNVKIQRIIMNYGLPYKGSKNKLATDILRLLPKKTHLIDLFCGGCAISHAAFLRKKYEHIHINDKNLLCPEFFLNALQGAYENETRWISREDFFRLKATDPYVAFVWSFGNNFRSYLYSKEIEGWKKALHYAIFFDDYSLGKEYGFDFSFLRPEADYQTKYRALRAYIKRQNPQRVEAIGGGRLQSFERYCWTMLLRHAKYRSKVTYCEPWVSSKSNGVCNKKKLQFTHSVLDYEDVEIPTDSVIYCDIPYENTEGYIEGETFDYERFYSWCERQTEPVFISSYDLPRDRFLCVAEYQHRSLLSYNTAVTERVFVPINQTEQGNLPPKEITLFDFV